IKNRGISLDTLGLRIEALSKNWNCQKKLKLELQISAGIDDSHWEQDQDYRQAAQTPLRGTAAAVVCAAPHNGGCCLGATHCQHEASHATSSEWPVASSLVWYSNCQRSPLRTWVGRLCARAGSSLRLQHRCS
ncbi:hypothetical protein AVEN_82061-1, partial [Araneus ventricosus]